MRRFIRLETMWDASPWLDVLSAEAQLVWIKLLCYVKGHGFDGKAKALVPLRAARMWNVGDESVRQLLKAAEMHGALTVENDEWVIVKWNCYQGDATGKERKARFDAKSKVPGNGRNALLPLRNGGERVTNAEKEKEKEKEKPPIVPQGGFDKFWETYPKRKGGSPKEKARQAFAKAIRGGATVEEVVAGVEGWKRANPDKIGTEFVPMPATWLNQKRWADDYDDVEPLYLPGEDVTRRVRNA